MFSGIASGVASILGRKKKQPHIELIMVYRRAAIITPGNTILRPLDCVCEFGERSWPTLRITNSGALEVGFGHEFGSTTRHVYAPGQWISANIETVDQFQLAREEGEGG